MADHVRRQLREAIATAVTGLATTAGRVYQSRAYALQATDVPCLLIYTEAEEASLQNISAPNVYERSVEVRIEGIAIATSDLDDTLDAIAKEVETALAAGITISSRTVPLFYQGCDIELDADGEKPKGRVTLRYRADIYTAAAAPDVFL